MKLPSTCRLCAEPLHHVVVDLGATPLANAYLRPEQLTEVESYYPLRLLLCERCFLLQVEAVVAPEVVFRDYAYFSSYADTLLRESKAFADAMVSGLPLAPGDRVIEIASNDGYLLQYFLAAGLDVHGIEPADTVAAEATRKGIPTTVRFFSSALAREFAARNEQARLVVANNVLAHVPDPGDFIDGLRILMAPGGTLAIQFHHLLALVEQGQFDTIYHEHFQYFSLATVREALAARGLEVTDVLRSQAQGGSLRVFAQRREDVRQPPAKAVADLLAREKAAGLRDLECYRRLGQRIASAKLGLLDFLVGAKRSGRSVVAYGAAAKGNTLLNYCGVHADLVEYVVDRNPHKQGLYMPGSRIPIRHPDAIAETRPDYVLILPWNLSAEIMRQMAHVRSWGGRFVIPIPSLRLSPAEHGSEAVREVLASPS